MIFIRHKKRLVRSSKLRIDVKEAARKPLKSAERESRIKALQHKYEGQKVFG